MIVAQNSGFVPQITHTDFAEFHIRKKGEVEKLQGSVIISAWKLYKNKGRGERQ